MELFLFVMSTKDSYFELHRLELLLFQQSASFTNSDIQLFEQTDIPLPFLQFVPSGGGIRRWSLSLYDLQRLHVIKVSLYSYMSRELLGG